MPWYIEIFQERLPRRLWEQDTQQGHTPKHLTRWVSAAQKEQQKEIPCPSKEEAWEEEPALTPQEGGLEEDTLGKSAPTAASAPKIAVRWRSKWT